MASKSESGQWTDRRLGAWGSDPQEAAPPGESPRRIWREVGRWQVTRWCCSSGLCVSCHERGNHGDMAKRLRVVHMEGVSESYARWVALNWSTYFEARAEEMPP